jgi:hypothetical protein
VPRVSKVSNLGTKHVPVWAVSEATQSNRSPISQLDLAFRDESNAVVEKAKARARKGPSNSTPRKVSSKTRLSGASSPELSGVSSASSSIINFAPSSIEDRAINCFFNNWISEARGPSHGYFNVTRDLLHDDGQDTLRTSIIASGLALEANAKHDWLLLILARRNYAAALAKISKVLRSPNEAVGDRILLSIIVVGGILYCPLPDAPALQSCPKCKHS